MAWNGSGTYVLNALYSPEVNGTTIDAVRYNGLLTDVATGITQALNKNGENSPTANINFGAFKITNLGAATTAGDAVAYNQPPPQFTQTVNGSSVVKAINSSAGVNATAGVQGQNDGGFLGSFGVSSSGYTAVTMIGASAGFVYSDGIGGLALVAAHAAGTIRFATAGSTERMRILATGELVIGGTTLSVGGGGADKLAVAGSIGCTSQLNALPGAATNFEIVNRSTGGIKLYTNAGSVTALEAKTTGDLVGLGVAITRVKTAATSRNSTTTLADDPHLVVPLGVGVWTVRAWLPVTIAASGGGNGWKVALAFSGTKSTDIMTVMSPDYLLSAMAQVAMGTGTSLATAASSTTSWLIIDGSLTVTVAGNISLQWAQNSSGVQNLTMMQGGHLTCTKVG